MTKNCPTLTYVTLLWYLALDNHPIITLSQYYNEWSLNSTDQKSARQRRPERLSRHNTEHVKN